MQRLPRYGYQYSKAGDPKAIPKAIPTAIPTYNLKMTN
jgi:hypothetical protein